MAAILADQLLLCLACKHKWTEKIIYNVGVAVWWDMHVRGTTREGVVLKEYSVTPAPAAGN